MKSPWRREWLPAPVCLPGKSHGQRSPVDYSPWGCKELDTVQHACIHHALKAKKVKWPIFRAPYLYLLSPGIPQEPYYWNRKDKDTRVIWRRQGSPLLLSTVLPLSTRGVCVCVCVPAGLLVLCKTSTSVCVCVCVCVCPCKTSGPVQNVHKTFGPHQRSLKLFPIQNIWLYLVHAQRCFFFLISFHFSKSLLWLLYNVVLVSTVQQSESFVCIHMYLFGGIPSHHAQRFWTGPGIKDL